MEDPVGFLHYPRADASKEMAGARVRHWHEYEQLMPNAQAEVQARRCMDCGTPHCHRYCPVHNLIPDWNALVNEQDWRVAYEQLEQTNNFPEFTGRVCSAPCEDACTLSIGSRPVTIRSIELAIAEHAWRAGWIKPQPNKFSVMSVLASAFGAAKKFNLTSNLNGGRRAMVPTGVFETLMPQDFLPTQLLRSLIVMETDAAQSLGALELDEEDVALCTFACPAKYEYGEALRDSLQKIEKEG